MTDPRGPLGPSVVGARPEPAVHLTTGSAAARHSRARSEARLRALSDVGRAGVGLAQAAATEQIVLAAMRACEADSASLGVWLPDRQVLRILLNVGDLAEWEEREPADEVYAADQSTWLAGSNGGILGAVVSLDDPDVPADEVEFLQHLGKRSSVNVPLLYGGSWWGELFVARGDDRPSFTPDDLDWISSVAAQVSAALESADHAAKVELLAQTDSLTGLANRRALDQWLDDAMEWWRNAEVPLGLAGVDLNGLKRINDDQGHDAGDRVLQHLGEILRDVAARFDNAKVARLGGDEFCIAVSGEDASGLIDAASEVCSKGWELLPHGLACGVVLTTDAVGSVEFPSRLLRLADAVQYRAKRIGSRVPVVAGRVLTTEQAVALSGADAPETPDRRLFRGREVVRLGHLTDATLRALDQANTDGTRARLALVADLVTHHVDGLGWWISLSPSGMDVVRTVDYSLYRRPPRVDTAELEVHNELAGTYRLSDYPQTAMALSGGSYAVTGDDPTADPAEVAILDGLHASGAVAAGARESDGDGWLIEVFLDELSGFGQELAGVLRLLVLAALNPRQQP